MIKGRKLAPSRAVSKFKGEVPDVEPKRSPGGQFTNKYPFHKTAVKGKFVVKLDRDDPEFRDAYNRVRAAAYAFYKRTDHKFSCRQIDKGVEVVRVQ